MYLHLYHELEMLRALISVSLSPPTLESLFSVTLMTPHKYTLHSAGGK